MIAQGERWAETFAAHPLTEAQRRAVGLAYARRCSQRLLPVIDRIEDGQPLRLALLGPWLYAVHGEQLWVFELPAKHHRDPANLVRAYRRYRKKSVTAPMEQWLLSGFYKQAREMAAAWARKDLDDAFVDCGLRGKVHSDYSLIKDPALRRRMFGYAHRTTYYLQRIGATLRQVRERMNPEVLKVLWGLGYHNGALAHWAMGGTTPRQCHYRCQALKIQPYLMPMALLLSAQTPGTAPEVNDDGVQALMAAGIALTQAIDAGQPFHEELAALLRTPGNGADHRRYAFMAPEMASADGSEFWTWRLGPPNRSYQHWTGADVKFLAGKNQRQGLRFFQVQRKLQTHPQRVVNAARHLPPERRPQQPSDWNTLGLLTGLVQRPDQVGSLLKGAPTALADPYFEHLASRVQSIHDTLDWLSEDSGPQEDACCADAPYCGCEDHRKWQRKQALLATPLTLRQWENLSERAHGMEAAWRVDLESRRQAANPAYQQMLRDLEKRLAWSPILLAPVTQGPLRLVERTDWVSLRDEGEELDHCVGGTHYAHSCARGHTRIWSIETLQGDRLSTAELRWDTERKRLICVQHQAYDNQMPSEAEEQLLQASMANRRLWHAGPWPRLADMDELDRLYQAHANEIQGDRWALHRSLWDALGPRYPALARARLTDLR